MLEICIDSVASARAAAAGGADRVELCDNLPEGGTTPSAGMIRRVREVFPGRLMVIIRPRGYDFLYDGDEMAVMEEDIRVARDLGADGVVFGCLTAEGRVDREKCARLLRAAGTLDVTFHRAFDMACDLPEAMDDIAALGIRRILTSGGMDDALSGAETIASLVGRAGGRLTLMPGGGVTPANLGHILQRTGAREIHLSARGPVESAMVSRNPDCSMGVFTKGREYSWRQTDTTLVRLARQALDTAVR